MSVRKKSDFDLASGVARLIMLVIFGAVFIPAVRQTLVGLGMITIGIIALLVLLVAGVALIRRSNKISPLRSARSFPLHNTIPLNSSALEVTLVKTTADLIEQLRNVDWFQFERIVGLAYRRLGYTVTCRGGANPDGGIDLIIEMAGQKSALQCKHWRTQDVGEPALRDFLGALSNAGIQKGIFITLRGYTGYAKQFAEKNGIELMNVTGLAKLLESTNARVDAEVLEILLDKRKFCPKCGAEMKLRTARRGLKPGQQFWGCSNFGPRGCQGRLPYQPRFQSTVAVAFSVSHCYSRDVTGAGLKAAPRQCLSEKQMRPENSGTG